MEHIDDLAWKIIAALASGIAMILGWLGKRTHDKVEQCVTRDELAKAIDAFRSETVRAHERSTETLSKLTDRVDAIWEHLAK